MTDKKMEELKEVIDDIAKIEKESMEIVKETTKKILKERNNGLEPTKALSPSKINTFMKCPREFFYHYVEKRPSPPNIHLVKGSVIHKVLEDFYRSYNPTPKKFLGELFKKTWNKSANLIKRLEITPEELKTHKKDALKMVMDFYDVHKRKMDGTIISGKAENEQHAFFLTKPKFREKYVKDEELHCRGYIDRVHKGYDGMITLGDYKTSNKYGIGFSADYKRQLSIYALLYHSQEGVMADFVSIIFLRFGEEFLLEVTPSLLKYARDTIDYVWAKTRSASFEDYLPKESRLCGWCPFQHICSGKEEREKKANVERLKKLFIKEEKKDETKV